MESFANLVVAVMQSLSIFLQMWIQPSAEGENPISSKAVAEETRELIITVLKMSQLENRRWHLDNSLCLVRVEMNSPVVSTDLLNSAMLIFPNIRRRLTLVRATCSVDP